MRNTLAPAIAAAAALAGACGWASLDAIAPPESEGGPTAPGAGGSPADVSVGDDAPAGPSPEACLVAATPVQQWSFDTSTEGWTLERDTNVPATLGWNGGAGDPSPGTLQADVTPASSDSGAVSGAWVAFVPRAPIDLSNRTISAWVWLDRGDSPNFKTFVQTGSQYNWADNGTVHLALHEWTCVSLPVSSPSYQQPSYDPTQAIRMGFEMLGVSPFRLFVDSVRYY